MDFKHEEGRIYAQDENGRLIAEVTFPLENGAANINHTFVDESLRGQGVAGKLLQAAVSQIEKDGVKAAPTCSYAAAWFEKHPEYSHLLK